MNATPARPPAAALLLAAALGLALLAKLPGALSAGFGTPQSAPCEPFSGALTPTEGTGAAKGQREAGNGGRSPASALPPLTALSARAGFSISSAADAEFWSQALGAGWFLDWQATMRRNFQGPEHWQMVRLSEACSSPSPKAAGWLALHFPGQVWVIGNEPDVIWQDNMEPEQYARYYHDYYQAIMQADPSAQVAVGGVAQGTPLRLAYLDRVLDSYRELYGEAMPVDWWTMHGFVLREERGSWGVEIPPGMPEVQAGRLYEVSDHGRLDYFAEQVGAFRAWMSARGYRKTPLAMTEFGILMPLEYGFPPEFVADYLMATFNYLNSATNPETGYPADGNRLVQRWAWFSLADSLYPSGDLANLAEDALTPVGEAFRTFIVEQYP